MSDYTPTKPTRVRVNPSRKTCEEIIRRILTTENSENGKNIHFKTATDFMAYFESLFPSGPALTKQVQRAIKSMGLAKDEDGYFLIGKTKADASLEREISALLIKSEATAVSLTDYETVLLKTDAPSRAYLTSLFTETKTLKPLFITIIETQDGLLFLTKDAETLQTAMVGLGVKETPSNET